MADVIEFPGETTLDTPIERVFEHAAADNLATVLVIGEGENGGLFFECSSPDLAVALWLLERAKWHLLNCANWDEDE